MTVVAWILDRVGNVPNLFVDVNESEKPAEGATPATA
jgi:hypothetical protein